MVLACVLGSALAMLGLDGTRRIDQYGHDVWTSQYGLPGQAVYQILQTPDGYLWLRTSTGLVRFDGVRFVSMDSALGTDPVRALAMSADGDLLIRTTSRTIVYKSQVFSDYLPPAPLPDGEAGALYESRDREVMIGADDFVFHQTASGVHLIRSGTAAVTSFLQDESGKSWVGGAHDLFSYREGVLRSEVDLSKLFAVTSMSQDRQHRMWVGTAGGLFEVDRSHAGSPRLKRVNAPEVGGEVKAILPDAEGNLWLATSTSGLVRLRNGVASTFHAVDGLTDNRVLSLFEDREGSLWVGTASGLDRFRNTKATTYTTLDGMPSDDVKSAVAGKDGSIFVFCNTGGLAQIKDGVITATRKIKGLTGFYGATLFKDRDGSLWLGMMGGLTHFKDGKFTVYGGKSERLAQKFISAISQDDEGMIVTTSDTVALRVTADKILPLTLGGQLTPLSRPGNYTFTIYADPGGTLWFGTVYGLYRFQPGQPPAKARVSQIDFAVTSISDDGRGSLWLGGRRPGLTRYRIADGRVTHYKKKDGFFDGYPSRVLFDDEGNPWISTSDGIYSAKRKDMDDFADRIRSTVPTTVYGVADGMKTSEASSAPSQPGGTRGVDGKLWFTTLKGIVMIDPRHLMHNDQAPPVVIESVVVDGAGVPAGADFVIAPGKDKIELRYTALSLLIPDRVRFKYQLAGYDKHWVEAGTRRVAYYNNLPPGHYHFKVIAANDDGVWNDVGASIGFKMQPHFYQTPSFEVLMALSGLLLAIGGQRWYTRRLRNRAAELSRVVDERTAELLESQRHLQQVAFLDSLTALPNRRMFAQEFRKQLALGKRRGATFSLLMIDLDRFKPINDTMGHDAGDLLLVEAATRLRAAVRETDCVARLGGDEFAILLAEDQDQAGIDRICQRIVDNFAPAVVYDSLEMRTTPSIGIATFPDHGDTQEILCRLADIALYQAKRAGGNSWQRYHTESLQTTTSV